jgi:trk system potassium uptake protein TrkA
MEITVPSSWVGKTIGGIAVRTKYGVNIVALKTFEHLNVLPHVDTKFKENDIVVVMGKNSDLKALQTVK